jgi:hypothetical protein
MNIVGTFIEALTRCSRDFFSARSSDPQNDLSSFMPASQQASRALLKLIQRKNAADSRLQLSTVKQL